MTDADDTAADADATRCIREGCQESRILPSASALPYCEEHLLESPFLLSPGSYNAGYVLQYLLRENAKLREAIENLRSRDRRYGGPP